MVRDGAGLFGAVEDLPECPGTETGDQGGTRLQRVGLRPVDPDIEATAAAVAAVRERPLRGITCGFDRSVQAVERRGDHLLDETGCTGRRPILAPSRA